MKTIIRSALAVLALATPVLAAPRTVPEERTAPAKEQKADDRVQAIARELQRRIAAVEAELARIHTEQAVSRAEDSSHPLWP